MNKTVRWSVGTEKQITGIGWPLSCGLNSLAIPVLYWMCELFELCIEQIFCSCCAANCDTSYRWLILKSKWAQCWTQYVGKKCDGCNILKNTQLLSSFRRVAAVVLPVLFAHWELVGCNALEESASIVIFQNRMEPQWYYLFVSRTPRIRPTGFPLSDQRYRKQEYPIWVDQSGE